PTRFRSADSVTPGACRVHSRDSETPFSPRPPTRAPPPADSASRKGPSCSPACAQPDGPALRTNSIKRLTGLLAQRQLPPKASLVHLVRQRQRGGAPAVVLKTLRFFEVDHGGSLLMIARHSSGVISVARPRRRFS